MLLVLPHLLGTLLFLGPHQHHLYYHQETGGPGSTTATLHGKVYTRPGSTPPLTSTGILQVLFLECHKQTLRCGGPAPSLLNTARRTRSLSTQTTGRVFGSITQRLQPQIMGGLHQAPSLLLLALPILFGLIIIKEQVGRIVLSTGLARPLRKLSYPPRTCGPTSKPSRPKPPPAHKLRRRHPPRPPQ